MVVVPAGDVVVVVVVVVVLELVARWRPSVTATTKAKKMATEMRPRLTG